MGTDKTARSTAMRRCVFAASCAMVKSVTMKMGEIPVDVVVVGGGGGRIETIKQDTPVTARRR